MILEGHISVKAAILGGHRTLSCLYVDEKKRDRELSFIIAKAKEKNIPIQRMKREELDRLAQGKTHGGVLCEASSRQYDAEAVLTRSSCPFLVLLEGVEDPYNLGYVIRSLYAGGCTGLILRRREWNDAEAVILRSSAGAYEYLPIVMSYEPAELVHRLKADGIHTFAAYRKDASALYDNDFRGPTLLAIGGEMRGLSTAVLQECETNIYIPYANDFRNALNAAGASAVLAFEVMRQRML